jgi:hypothetical protein
MSQKRRRNGQFAAGPSSFPGRDKVPSVAADIRAHADMLAQDQMDRLTGKQKTVWENTLTSLARAYGVPKKLIKPLGKGDWDTSGLYRGPIEVAGVKLFADVYLEDTEYGSPTYKTFQNYLRRGKIVGRTIGAHQLADLIERQAK